MQKGIDLLGGAGEFAAPGEKILLKPNWIMAVPPENCATTHPAIFKAVCEIFSAAGADLCYGDSPGRGTTEEEHLEAARATGFLDVGVELGIPIADFLNGREINTGTQTFFVANGALDCDGIFSLPKLKTHGFLKMTGCVKNQFGCVPGLLKGEFHVKLPDREQFARMLVDLNLCLKPRLYVLDGIMAMEGNGPRGGNPHKLGLLAMSTDPVALDAVACRICRINPYNIPTIYLGEEMGLGTAKPEEMELLGDPLDKWKNIKFNAANARKIPSAAGSLRNHLVAKPYIEAQKCVNCNVCIEMCPVSPTAVFESEQENQIPKFDYKRCIRCYCCQEVCPEGAIKLKTPWLGKITRLSRGS